MIERLELRRRLVRRLRQEQLSAVAVEAPAAMEPVQAPNPARSSGVLAWILLLVGGALASGGGLILLGLVLATLQGEVNPEDVNELLVGGALLGVLPLAVGLVMFRGGIRLRK